MKKILMSLLIIGTVAALIGGGVYAAFSDPESTTNNTFTAGTIDLKVNGNEWTTAISITNWKPGLNSSTYTFKNTGSIDGNLVFTWGSNTETDHADDSSGTFEFAGDSNPDMEMDATQYARLIYVTITGGGGATNVVTEGDISGNNGDGKISLKELQSYSSTIATLSNNAYVDVTFALADAFDAGSSNPPSDWTDYYGGSPTWTLLTGGETWNVPQADGLKVDITATLSQV